MPVTRAVVYTRVSTSMQERDGVSLETQLELARQHCEAKGWALTETYTDVMSGRSDRRPDLKRLEADAQAKCFDVVIVYKVDRLSRSARKYYELLSLFRDKDISIFSLTQPIDTTTPTGKFMLGQMILIAELEADNTSERVASAMRTVAAKGKHTGGWCPLGYRYIPKTVGPDGVVHDGHLELDQVEAEIVKLLFETFLRLRSCRGVAVHLNELGHRTKRGKLFSIQAVSDILRNPAYTGIIAYGRSVEIKGRSGRRSVPISPEKWIIRENAHPVIIDQKTWDEVQEIIRSREGMSSRLKYGQQRYPWSGLLYCASCGSILKRTKDTSRGSLGFAYVCAAFNVKGKSACKSPCRASEKYLNRVVLVELDHALRELMRKALDAPVTRKQGKPQDRSKQIAMLEARREREKELFRGGFCSFEEMATKIRGLDEQLKALALPTQALVPALPDLPDAFLDLWERLNEAARGELLRTFIANCEVAKDRFTIFLKPFNHQHWPEQLIMSKTPSRWHRE